MDRGGIDEEEKPVGELFSKLIDEGKAYAKAELGLAKATAEAKADSAKKPITDSDRPLSRSQADRVSKISRFGRPAEKPSSSMTKTRRSP